MKSPLRLRVWVTYPNTISSFIWRYSFLSFQEYCPSPVQSFGDPRALFYTDFRSSDIRWNFEKFLIDRRGKPIIRYSTTFLPGDISNDIQNLLAAPEY